MDKVWNKQAILDLVAANDKAAVKALLVVYGNQTQDEQSVKTTKHHNGMGFTAFDAEVLSSVAESFQQYGRLTERQIELVRKRITKYWRQLLQATEAKGGQVSYK